MKKHTEKEITQNNERVARKYDRINLVVYKGEKQKIIKEAKENNETVNGFLNRIIAENVDDFIPTDSDRMSVGK